MKASERKPMSDWMFQTLLWGGVIATYWLANQIF